MRATHWIWQEFDGKPQTVLVRDGQNEDVALAAHFKAHEKFRLEAPRSRTSLRNFLPEVTPGVLRLYAGKVLLWSSEPVDMKKEGIVVKIKRKKVVEVEGRSGVTLVLKCEGAVHAEIIAKALIDGVASFDTRCD